MKGQESRSSSSCAACKLLKRRCTASCAFAPYFRSDEPKRFANVHKVFGASNVSKILTEVPEEQREEAVNSLVYEAEARLIDPVYGCIGAIALLQTKMIQLQHDLAIARARLARYASNPDPQNPLFLLDHHLLQHHADMPPPPPPPPFSRLPLATGLLCALNHNYSSLPLHHSSEDQAAGSINHFTQFPFP